MPGFLDPKAYIFDLDGTLIDSLGVWDKVDEILASEIARVDYSDLDLPRFREISLLNWYGHVRRGVSPLRQLNQGTHSGIVS